MNLIEAILYLKENENNRVKKFSEIGDGHIYKLECGRLKYEWSGNWDTSCICINDNQSTFEIYEEEKLYSFSEMLEEIVAIKNIVSSVDFISMVNKDVVVSKYRNNDKIVFGDSYIDYEIPINCYHGKWMRKIE